MSGHVKRPGIFEACVGLTLRDLIYDLGGGVAGGELLAVIPGGSSCPILRADEIINAPGEKSPLHPWHGKSVLDVPLGVDTFRALGTMLGTCCAIVLSDKADPVLAFHNLMRFYRHESCGQCTPCREGSAWILRLLDRIVKGEGTIEELDRLSEVADNIMGNTICAFGEGTAMPALGFLQKFRKELEARVRGKTKPGRLALPGPVGPAGRDGGPREPPKPPGKRRGAQSRCGRRVARMITLELVIFGLAALFVLVGGLITVAARNPIRSAMGLLATIVGVAGMYLLLSAEFLAAVQVMVYAGAVVVLFLFVIMLLGPLVAVEPRHPHLERPLPGRRRLPRVRRRRRGAARARRRPRDPAPRTRPARSGRSRAIGRELFGVGLVPFELSSALLLVAVVGAVAVARGRQPDPTMLRDTALSRAMAGAGAPEPPDVPSSTHRKETAP